MPNDPAVAGSLPHDCKVAQIDAHGTPLNLRSIELPQPGVGQVRSSYLFGRVMARMHHCPLLPEH
jgi:hypothetical protein